MSDERDSPVPIPGQQLGVPGVSRWLGQKPATIRKWGRSGFLPARRAGSLLLFDRDEITAWLRGLPPATEDAGERQRRGAETRRTGKAPRNRKVKGGSADAQHPHE